MDGMTREELIARIEAGETGPELLCAIALLVRWRFDDLTIAEGWRRQDWLDRGAASAVRMAGIPDWLTSLDAAVSLVGDLRWSVHHDGVAVVWPKGAVFGKTAKAANNPAAALVAAWLKATT